MGLKSIVKRILPENIKAVIRPFYKMLCKAFSSRNVTQKVTDSSQAERDRPSEVQPVIAIRKYGEFEVVFRRKTADEDVIAHSFDNDIFFTGVPEYQPKEGHVIIDMGAHIGTFSLLASSNVGTTGKVFAVEASNETFALLRINVALNKCDNISVHKLAMSNNNGICNLYHDLEEGNWGHSTVKELSTTVERVQSCSLSTFMRENDISECHFIKFNIEGAEFPVILSTPSDILQRFGIMLVLYHCDLWSNNTEQDLISHLESSGFNCVIRNKTEKRGWIVATRDKNIDIT
jgi:FkbM family methyltransferase